LGEGNVVDDMHHPVRCARMVRMARTSMEMSARATFPPIRPKKPGGVLGRNGPLSVQHMLAVLNLIRTQTSSDLST
jgi:hypothetical protein